MPKLSINNTKLYKDLRLQHPYIFYVKDFQVYFYILEQLSEYFYYVKNLKFEEKPDYMLIRRMFKDLFY